MRKYLFILLAFISLQASGQFIMVTGGGPSTQGGDVPYDTTNWYWKDVAQGGDDANSGHHPDSAKTSMTALAALATDPGDTIFAVTGNTWRLTTTLIFDDWVGTDADRIVLTSYGDGDKPRFLGSDSVSLWTSIGDTLWYVVKASIDSFPAGRPVIEQLNGTYTWCILETTTERSALDTLYEYYFNLDTIMLRWESATSPFTAFASFEIPQLGDVMQSEDPSEYISINGLEIAYGISGHIFRNGFPGNAALKGLEIRNNHFHHKGIPDDGSTGMDVNYTDMIIEGNTIHDIGRRLISILCYDGNETQIRNTLIQNNILYNGYHSAIDIFGLNEDSPGISNTTIRNNFISLDTISTETPHFIYIDDQTVGTCPVDSTFVYNNIMIGTASSAIVCDETSNAFLYHNTCWASNPLVLVPQQISFTVRSTNCRSINNLLFDQDYRLMLWTSGAPPDSMDYNLYWQTIQTSHFVDISTTRYRLDTQWAAYQAATSLDGNSLPNNPVMNQGSWLDIDGPTYPEWLPGAAAPNAGTPRVEVTTDFYGRARSATTPTIGAVE